MKLTKLVKQIALINVVLFLYAYIINFTFYNEFALFPNSGKVYQYITHMFLHANFTHIIFNMLAFLSFASIVEKYFGYWKFLSFYLLSGLGAAFLHIGLTGSEIPMVGASGAIFGVIAVTAILKPDMKVYLFFILGIKAKWLVPCIIIFEIVFGFIGDSRIAHFAHVGGALTGALFFIINKYSVNEK